MAEDNALPKVFARIHPRYKVPHFAILLVGLVSIILILSGSLVFIASVSLVSLGLCYIIGCFSYIGLRIRWPDIERPYKAPWGIFGSVFSMFALLFVIAFADRNAILSTAVISLVSLGFWFFVSRKRALPLPSVEEEVGTFKEPKPAKMKKLNRQYRAWIVATAVFCAAALAIYLVPAIMLISR